MIKKINSANAGVKRPLRISDIQDIWTALNVLHRDGVTTGLQILFGFNDKGDGNLSEGVLVNDGVMYYHADLPSSRIAIGADVYGHELAGVDQRVFDDATTQDFSFNMVATVSSSTIPLGTFTLNYVAQHKTRKRYREVTGRLMFAIVDPSAPNLEASFAPDNAMDSDVTVATPVKESDKVMSLTITDGNGVKMKPYFTASLIASANVLSMIPLGQVPDLVMASESVSSISMYYANNLVASDWTIEYRIKILFDV